MPDAHTHHTRRGEPAAWRKGRVGEQRLDLTREGGHAQDTRVTRSQHKRLLAWQSGGAFAASAVQHVYLPLRPARFFRPKQPQPPSSSAVADAAAAARAIGKR